MTGKDALGPVATGPSGDDPVAAARQWLARNGAEVPEIAQTNSVAQSQPKVESAPAGRHDASGRRSQSVDADVDANPETVARTIVLRKLAAQARTRHELAKALAARQVPDEVAQTVLERFEAVGLVDDATFAKDWVESRQQRRYLSKSALRRELQTKGVDRENIDAAVAQVDGSDETSAAQALAERKLRSVAGLPREVQYRRLAGALARRGFSGGVSAAVIGPLLDAAHEGD